MAQMPGLVSDETLAMMADLDAARSTQRLLEVVFREKEQARREAHERWRLMSGSEKSFYVVLVQGDSRLSVSIVGDGLFETEESALRRAEQLAAQDSSKSYIVAQALTRSKVNAVKTVKLGCC